MRAPLFPGAEGVSTDEPTELVPLTLSADAEALVSAGGHPVIWQRRFGRGRVVGSANHLLGDKAWRGTLLQVVLAALPAGVAPLLGSLVYYVDDCPMPIFGARRDPVARDLGLADVDFYRQVFWPDLVALARDNSLKLTFGLVFSYDDHTQGDFSVDQFYLAAGRDLPRWMAREAVRLGHEVALHGLNHQSLVRKPGPTSKGWPDQRRMIDGLRRARLEWERVFGPGQAPTVYIAPNNDIDRDGKAALHAAFPEVRVLAASYIADDLTAGQEYDEDPDLPAFFDFPRATSDLFPLPGTRTAIIDQVMLMGAWTHFIHPDDVFDGERGGGRSWAQLIAAARATVAWVRGDFPWLRPMTASEAYHALVRYRTAGFGYQIEDHAVRVNLGSAGGDAVPFALRLDAAARDVSAEDGAVVAAYPANGYYVILGRGPRVTVRWR
jgi:hypothetical protein